MQKDEGVLYDSLPSLSRTIPFARRREVGWKPKAARGLMRQGSRKGRSGGRASRTSKGQSLGCGPRRRRSWQEPWRPSQS